MQFRTLDLLIKFGREFGHSEIRKCGFNETGFIICSYVHFNSGCSQEELVHSLKIDKTTAAKSISNLEADGLITRVQGSSDRRKKNLFLSSVCENRIAEIISLHDRWLGQIMNVLSEDEIRQFDSYCTRLLNEAEKLSKKLTDQE